MMEHKKLLVGLCILLILITASAQIKTIKTIKIATTTKATTTTTLVKCGSGCECMTDASAKSDLKEPQKCGSGICGYYYGSGMTSYQQIPKYCYKDAATATTTTTARLAVTTTSTTRLAAATTTTLPRMSAPATEPGCKTCKACSDELASGKKNVTVGADLSSSDASCIIFSTDDATFDCRGHTIRGYGEGIEFYYGIDLRGDDNVIRNCTIEGFEAGIAAYGASDNLIEDNILKKNGDGIWLGGGRLNNATGEVTDGSDENRIGKNRITENTHGIYFMGNKDTMLGENRICRNTVADIYTNIYAKSSGNSRNEDTCDLIYNWNSDADTTWCDSTCTMDAAISVGSTSDLRDALAGGMYGTVTLTGDIGAESGLVFGASHVTLDCDHHRINGGGTGAGIDLSNRVNVEVRNCTIEEYGTGILMRSTSHSRILDNTIRDNDYGLVVASGEMHSRSSNVTGNWIKPNDVYGVYLDGDAWDNSFKKNNIGGGQYSLYTTAKCDNDILDSNKGAGDKKIGYYHDAAGLSVEYPIDRKFSELILCNVRRSTFAGIEVDNSGMKKDGIVAIDSEDVEFSNPYVKEAYIGIAVVNSTNVTFSSGTVKDPKKDCVSVEKSGGVKIDESEISGCGNGVYVGLSTGTEVTDSEIKNCSIAAVHIYMSSGSLIEDNTITGRGKTAAGRGVFIEEASEGNSIRANRINLTADGIRTESGSTGNEIDNNRVCGNFNDIYDTTGNNSGDYNTCSVPIDWNDEGTGGCTNCCNPAVNDIDGDGVDNDCDCADLYQSYSEDGVDCGGKCSECVECTWCGPRIVPLRIKGRPNDGYIDMVFTQEDDWGGNWSGFEARMKDAIRKRFLGLPDISIRPISSDYADMMNFYLYRGDTGQATSDADSCYNPEGEEGYLCIGCKGWLPGEKAYHDWVYACSFSCAFSLGLACGCLAYEPEHFWDEASFADSAGIIYKDESIRGCSGFGPTSHFQAPFQGQGKVVIHEAGHSLLGLTDEYCGDTAYSQADDKRNVWDTMSECTSTAAAEGWTNGTCRQIKKVDENGTTTCEKDLYRYDSDSPFGDVMRSSAEDSLFKEADVRRINYLFDHWPSGGSAGIISYVQMSGGRMRGVMSRVVPNHPDLGMWVSDFVGVTSSAEGAQIDKFSFSDPRITMTDDGSGPVRTFSEDTTFTLIVPMHGGVRWLNIYNGSTGQLLTTIDLGPAVWNHCSEVNWTDPYCDTVDIDDNSVPDQQETSDWVAEERIRNMTFTDRPDLIVQPEKIPEAPQGIGLPLIGDGTIAALSGSTLLTGGLLLIIAVLLILLLWKRKKK